MTTSKTMTSIKVTHGNTVIEMALNPENGRYEVRGKAAYYGADQIERILKSAEDKGATVERTYSGAEAVAAPAVAHPAEKAVAKKYALHNAFDVRDNIKDAGAKWDAGRKAWIVTEAMLNKFNARTHTYGMAWLKGWAKVRVEEIAE